MAIAGNFARVEEVVEDAELQRELMFVWGDSRTEHREAWVAVACRLAILTEVAKYLIVGAVFFDDVDDMADPAAGATGKCNLFLCGLHAIRGKHGLGPCGQIAGDFALVERC